ncbi:DEKNAAC105179 [Brettanomyces naardenensis]|uniref:Casein kinase II subunit beta n=1 Tax=Brettanomyces naardenensis TaxID=13370 RepID=A0A448YSS2_BRENA|nr:DEKNAAC105179 [Brettanomyces naardenensis]
MTSRQSEYVSDSGSDYTEYWVDWFLGSRGNEYFCDVDLEYITDRFNLTGLNQYVDRIGLLVDIITDRTQISETQPEEARARLEDNAKFLYALIHARYIITSRGLSKMLEKYRNGDFGYCPRVNCKLTPLLPVGLSDKPRVASVKLYCPNCEDLYNPKSSRHSSIDGAFFGTSFPAMFLQNYPELVPTHNVDVYIPKIFGFQLHTQAQLTRWRLLKREQLLKRLEGLKIDYGKEVPGGFAEPVDEVAGAK